MKQKQTLKLLYYGLSLLTAGAAIFVALPAPAQQITGTPGSPSATITLDGKQIPAPSLPFGGVIKESALNSKQRWPPRIVPPQGAPNILLMMTIDETFDIGSDTRSGVDNSYELTFRFTGKIDKLTFKLGPSQLAAADRKVMKERLAQAKD